ncbi:dihydrodipicolinate synthase family protein [Ornithinibacillus californiensis]|uniref:dihydrodipicolinate synthase family protein n=1 Tax=Ornithinibacillus californiensis TaxID=161536 RepID=UPI00064DF49E|nr:dihydrodipicolinate synthase family protein [Ornithinibacillus californiensis]
MIKQEIHALLHEGTVIPAYPLALTADRQFDERGQRALTRYYIDAGVGGIAVGVHTTQFEIRDPEFNLFEKVLTLAVDEIDNYMKDDRPFIKIAGICGELEQATYEATFAKNLGYDLGLLSFRGLNHLSEEELIHHTKEIAKIIPVFGFYLQPAVGGRELSFDFWKKFADIPNVHAIKIAPFDRYRTLDVVRAVCHSEQRDDIALYTGNDDNIITDLITNYEIPVNGKIIKKHIVGGLLGHWAAWTKKAVEQFEEIKTTRKENGSMDKFNVLSHQVTDANSAFFDVRNRFKGCIAGINEILARQGILQGNWCLLEKEKLSPGQSEEIVRVYREYPHLHDDDFVKNNLETWLN